MPTSKTIVSLRAVAAEMDLPSDDWTAFIHRRTGELITVTDEEARAVEDDAATEDLPDGQAEQLPKVREALASDDFLAISSKFDINEYSIMKRFCEQVADSTARYGLLRAIRGSGAFGRFKALANHCRRAAPTHDDGVTLPAHPVAVRSCARPVPARRTACGRREAFPVRARNAGR